MITLKSYAKINISLDLVGKRDDGYHLLRTVMQTVSLCDYITLSHRGRDGINMRCNRPYIPTDEKNIAYKTALKFFEYTGISPSVNIGLRKYIPCGAGLGGGSSNGAAVFDGLCKLYGVDIPTQKKAELTRDIGADIPFFFYGGTALCEGIGEIVTPLAPLPECRIIIAKPPVSLSTAAIFGSPKTKEAFGGSSTDGVLCGIEKGDISAIINSAKNALEGASIDECRQIENIKLQLLENGADFSMMSGSGSAVFGIFTDYKKAKRAYYSLLKNYKEVYITKPTQF